ncbi:unnamed protein product [Callosobruchus maculatus]|uniref:Uncharacterized protein n=1 Tax=Callosobruchus maculatus TaxID=64391 RepID=A0A653CXD6_CALMS|nr:unnamed protein product [Callosobruchus maculatus]
MCSLFNRNSSINLLSGSSKGLLFL